MINVFIRFYISMSVVTRPIDKFVIDKQFRQRATVLFGLPRISQGIFLSQPIHHILLRRSN